MTQKELGEKIGISQQQIAQYENGKRIPKIETIDKIAKALECSVYELRGMQDTITDFDAKIDIIKKLNDMYKDDVTVLSLLAEYSMTSEQIKDYIAECNMASEQISNYIAKYNLDSLKYDAELPSKELKEYVLECNIASEQINNYMAIYQAASEKLNLLYKGKAGAETLSRIMKYNTKVEQINNKNVEKEEKLLADFRKLTTEGQQYILQTMDMVKNRA